MQFKCYSISKKKPLLLLLYQKTLFNFVFLIPQTTTHIIVVYIIINFNSISKLLRAKLFKE